MHESHRTVKYREVQNVNSLDVNFLLLNQRQTSKQAQTSVEFQTTQRFIK